MERRLSRVGQDRRHLRVDSNSLGKERPQTETEAEKEVLDVASGGAFSAGMWDFTRHYPLY